MVKRTTKGKNWIVFRNGEEILCAEDLHVALDNELMDADCEILGYPYMETPKEAIAYICEIRGI
jgi:hypothetical protein